MRRFLGVTVLGLALSAPAVAGTISQYQIGGSYTAVDVGNVAGAPTINDTGNSSLFLSSPFTENLTVGQNTGPTNFLLVSPTSGSGLVTGSILVDFKLSGPNGAAVTSVSSTSGANQAALISGQVQIQANYEINYITQTDCITWTSSCTAGGPAATPLTDTLGVNFAGGSVLNIGLYDWADWDMQPGISFDLMQAPQAPASVPEPGSMALIGTGIAMVVLMTRRKFKSAITA